MGKIGKQIQELRKTQHVTQEDLGRAVGVTTQAVSKWENGGTPDAELLPAIADFFHVHIDDLFGRSSNPKLSLNQYVYQRLCQLPEKERIQESYRVFHAMMNACTNIEELSKILESEELKMYQNQDIKFGYQLVSEHMIGYMSLLEQTPFCYFLPEPSQGYGASLLDEHIYQDLFVFLGQKDVMKVLIQLYHLANSEGFTTSLIAKQCKIKEEQAAEIIRTMVEKQWVVKLDINTGESMLNAYIINQNSSFIPFLLLANEMISPTLIGYCIAQREKPILYHKQQEHDKTTR